ncbi:hypothetical protein [Virgibacillus senegalensis]|uniref:hypothetical protein n=1 Tax=Virgibacillus senegalensis TaxID=1499679 RepID=UPI00069D6997|nr:hypothetical protein [Virgibacillus senegalensis]
MLLVDEMENKEKVYEFVNNQLIDLFNKEDYLRIVKITNGKIAGFSKKNFHKVPEGLLKNVARKQIQKIKNITKFLNTFIEHRKDYFNLEVREFVVKIEGSELTEVEKLILFYVNYPEIYKQNMELIEYNIKEKKPCLHRIYKLSVTEKLEIFFNINKEKLQENLNYVNFHNEENKSLKNIKISSLREYLISESLPLLGEGFYLNMYKSFEEEWRSWEEKDQISFINLGIHDAIAYYYSLLKQLEELKKQKKSYEEKKKIEVKELNSLLSDKSEELKEVKDRNRQKEDDINELLNEHIKLSEEYEEYKRGYKNIESELSVTKNLLNSYKKEQIEIENKIQNSTSFLFENEKIYLFTKVRDSTFANYLEERQIIYFNKNTDLGEILANIEKDEVCFINFDGVSTKDSFQLERPFKEKNIIYRTVSGGAINIVRKIVYYLEGELHNETKETN